MSKSSTPVEVYTSDIPEEIKSRISEIVLCCDIMKVNQIAFFVTISRQLKFGTVEMLTNTKKDCILQSLKNTISVYTRRGLTVTHALMEGQFECLRNNIYDIGIDLNIVGANEHVPEAE